MKNSRKKIYIIYLVILLFIFAIVSFSVFHVGVNMTSSMPIGFYREVYKQKKNTLTYGDIVSFQLDKEIYTLTHAEKYTKGRTLLKYVYGLPGDSIEILENGIFIQKKSQTLRCMYALPKHYDSTGNKTISLLKSGVIPKGKIFVYSYHTGSFDSRYFALVDINTTKKMYPLLTF